MSVKSPANFVAGVLLPALSLGLAFSVLLNGILLATRPSGERNPPVADRTPVATAPSPEVLPPGGFGIVGQGMRRYAQRAEGIASGAYRYELPKNMLPSLPSSLPLYRDAGVTANESAFMDILGAMRVPLHGVRLLPDNLSFTTVDGQYDVLVNVRDRTVEVSRIARSSQDVSSEPVKSPLSDERMIAVASAFAQELGIDVAALGTPTIQKLFRTVEAGSAGTILAPGIEEIRWPLLFGEYPVVDQVGRPVSALSVFVAHRSQQAVALNMHVISPDLLSSSPYPTAPSDVMVGLALDGGMAPVDGGKGKAVPLTYQSASLAYMLPAYDPQRPTYVAPVIVLRSDIARTCKVKPCTPWTWTTYVPALDPTQFAWVPGQFSSSSVAPASSQSATSSQSPSSAPAPVASSAAAKQVSPTEGLQILR